MSVEGTNDLAVMVGLASLIVEGKPLSPHSLVGLELALARTVLHLAEKVRQHEQIRTP